MIHGQAWREIERRQVKAQLNQFARYADATIQTGQWQAIQAGSEHAHGLLEAAGQGVITEFNRLPADAVGYMIGFQQDGSPLLDVLNRYGTEAGQAIADRLVQGLMLGQGPAKVSRMIRKDAGMALWQALRLARTETLRAYRSANMETYQANSDIVEGWYWMSARNSRTCACCWAMDGTFHKLGDTLDDHPNGRCTAVPKLKGMELPDRLSGVEAFEKLSEVDKFRVLGPSKFAAYRAGDLKLTDLIGVKHSSQWGRMFYERSAVQAGLDVKKYLQLYRDNPVARLLTIDEVVSESLSAFEKSGRTGSSVSFYFGNVLGKPYYAVSAYTDLTHRIMGNEIDPKELEGYIRKYQGLLQNQQIIVGLWHNAEDGYTYLDVSALIKDKDIAIRLGKRYNQIAVFDLYSGEEIATGGSGIPIPHELLPPLKDRLGE